MSLFVDGDLSTIEDLRRYESSILDVASSEGIAIDAKIDLAHREMGVQLSAFLTQRRGAAALNDLSGVVMTDALGQWHTLQCLAAIYRDAYNSQLNDRYAGKWKEYVRLAERTAFLTLDIGLPMSLDPLRRPAIPRCSSIPGGGSAAETFFIEIAWVDGQGRRSARSRQIAYSVNSGELLRVEAEEPASNARGFHVYAGITPDSAPRRTAHPVAIDTAWIQASAGLDAGLPDLPEQQPDYFIERVRTWNRG